MVESYGRTVVLCGRCVAEERKVVDGLGVGSGSRRRCEEIVENGGWCVWEEKGTSKEVTLIFSSIFSRERERVLGSQVLSKKEQKLLVLFSPLFF